MLSLIQNIFSFIVLILLQVLVLNNVQFLGFLNPYIYILFILSLPVKFPRWITLILGFVLGLIIDIFSNTIGIHAFATVLIAFFRAGIIKLFISSRKVAILYLRSIHSELAPILSMLCLWLCFTTQVCFCSRLFHFN